MLYTIEFDDSDSVDNIIDKRGSLIMGMFDDLKDLGIETDIVEDASMFENRIPVDKDNAIRFSEIFNIIPELAVNSIVSKGVDSKTLYTITLDGKNVTPDILIKKNNGSYISNMKGTGNKFGKQTDIDKFDSSVLDSATLAGSIFAVASAATAQYYLKNIDDKLLELQNNTREIIEFLDKEKSTKIESDYELLGKIIKNIDIIKTDEKIGSIKIEQISAIQRDSKANIGFYKDQLDKNLTDYKTNKKGGKQDDKIAKSVRKSYYYYRISLQEYAITKLAEVMLLTNYNQDYLEEIRTELLDYSSVLKDDINRILSVIYDYSADKIDTKMKSGFAKTLKTVGNAMDKTPLKKTELGGKLNRIGDNTNQEIQTNIKKRADYIVTRDDYGIIEPYPEMINKLLCMIKGNVHLIGTEDEMYIMY